MYHRKSDFVRAVVKIAQTQVGDNEDQSTKGQQTDDTPELLQPDDGKGSGSRGEEESFSTAMEEQHKENRQGGYLPDAFQHFKENAQQDSKVMKGLLSNYDKDAVVSKAPLDAAQEKMGAARLGAFADELQKILKR